MRNPAILLGSLGIGAGLMYFLDPDRGKRRRGFARDKALHLSKVAERRVSKKRRDVQNHIQGVLAETEKLFTSETVTDKQLLGRVRSTLGRLTSHPHAVKTDLIDGKVTLSGPVLSDELEDVLEGIASVGGVKEVENRLEPHESDENFKGLLGRERQREAIVRRHQEEWTPQIRILAAIAGGGLAFLGAMRRDVLSSLLASMGVGLITRSATNKPISSLFAKQESGTTVKIHKSIKIDTPRENVFEMMKYPQYFPYFMTRVQNVERIGEKQFLWVVDGIGDYPIQWKTEVKKVVPNELIEWKIIGDRKNDQTGFLRLEPIDEKSTRLHVEIEYEPYGGKFGHFVAGLFHRDPKSELDDDFLRLKTYLEKGKLPHDAAIKFYGRDDMKVKEIMTENPAFATLNTKLQEVAKLMAEKDCGAIPVVESEKNKKPVGIITDRDLAIRTIAKSQNPLQKVAGEVMTEGVITVTPEQSVESCCQKMEKNQIRRAVVVDEAGVLQGIVAQADIARKAPEFETAELVKDISQPPLKAEALVV